MSLYWTKGREECRCCACARWLAGGPQWRWRISTAEDCRPFWLCTWGVWSETSRAWSESWSATCRRVVEDPTPNEQEEEEEGAGLINQRSLRDASIIVGSEGHGRNKANIASQEKKTVKKLGQRSSYLARRLYLKLKKVVIFKSKSQLRFQMYDVDYSLLKLKIIPTIRLEYMVLENPQAYGWVRPRGPEIYTNTNVGDINKTQSRLSV